MNKEIKKVGRYADTHEEVKASFKEFGETSLNFLSTFGALISKGASIGASVSTKMMKRLGDKMDRYVN